MSKSARILITSMLSVMLLPQAAISQVSDQGAASGKRDEMSRVILRISPPGNLGVKVAVWKACS